jgi:hypothetical protein
MTEKIEPAVGATGEGGISKVAGNSLSIASTQPKIQPLGLAEFIAIGRQVTQETGRNRRAMVRYNAYVDIDMELSIRRSHPVPTSSDELQDFMRGVDGSKSYGRLIHNVWLDYERARGASRRYRSGGGTHDL